MLTFQGQGSSQDLTFQGQVKYSVNFSRSTMSNQVKSELSKSATKVKKSATEVKNRNIFVNLLLVYTNFKLFLLFQRVPTTRSYYLCMYNVHMYNISVYTFLTVYSGHIVLVCSSKNILKFQF